MLTKSFTADECRVTFTLAREIAIGTTEVFLIGDFNNWDRTANPMRLEGEAFVAKLVLPLNCIFHFQYYVDGIHHNDWNADFYEPNPYHGDNSVLVTTDVERALREGGGLRAREFPAPVRVGPR